MIEIILGPGNVIYKTPPEILDDFIKKTNNKNTTLNIISEIRYNPNYIDYITNIEIKIGKRKCPIFAYHIPFLTNCNFPECNIEFIKDSERSKNNLTKTTLDILKEKGLEVIIKENKVKVF